MGRQLEVEVLVIGDGVTKREGTIELEGKEENRQLGLVGKRKRNGQIGVGGRELKKRR